MIMKFWELTAGSSELKLREIGSVKQARRLPRAHLNYNIWFLLVGSSSGSTSSNRKATLCLPQERLTTLQFIKTSLAVEATDSWRRAKIMFFQTESSGISFLISMEEVPQSTSKLTTSSRPTLMYSLRTAQTVQLWRCPNLGITTVSQRPPRVRLSPSSRSGMRICKTWGLGFSGSWTTDTTAIWTPLCSA